MKLPIISIFFLTKFAENRKSSRSIHRAFPQGQFTGRFHKANSQGISTRPIHRAFPQGQLTGHFHKANSQGISTRPIHRAFPQYQFTVFPQDKETIKHQSTLYTSVSNHASCLTHGNSDKTITTRWIQQRTGGQVKVATYLQAIEGNAHLSNILYSKRYEDGNRDADRLVNGDGHEHFVRRHVTAHEDNGEEGEEEDELDREKVGGQNQGLQVAGPSDAVHLQAARDGERSVSPFHLRANPIYLLLPRSTQAVQACHHFPSSVT